MLTNSDNSVVFPPPSPPVNSPCWRSPTDCGRKGRHKTLHTNNVRNVWRGFLSLLGIAVLLQLIIVYNTSQIWRFRPETRFKTSTGLAITRHCDNRAKPTARESDSWLVWKSCLAVTVYCHHTLLHLLSVALFQGAQGFQTDPDTFQPFSATLSCNNHYCVFGFCSKLKKNLHSHSPVKHQESPTAFQPAQILLVLRGQETVWLKLPRHLLLLQNLNNIPPDSLSMGGTDGILSLCSHISLTKLHK